MSEKVTRFLRTLTLPRIATLAIGIVLLISGLGTTTFWVLKNLDRETFIPFGLSTFRSLGWGMADAILAFACLSTAVLHLIDEQYYAPKFAIGTGLLFIVMGLMGLWIDLIQRTDSDDEQELQPMFLNIWFIGWGLFCIWIGHGSGQRFLHMIDGKIRVRWLPVSTQPPPSSSSVVVGGSLV
jgi:hypothetical protein